MKSLLYLLLLLTAANASAQSDKVIRSLLARRDAARFYRYVSRFKNNSHEGSLYLTPRREITQGFEESGATFEYYSLITDTPNRSYNVYGYAVHLLTAGNTIIYYHILEGKDSRLPPGTQPQYFADWQEMQALKKGYRRLFNKQLDTTQLFLTVEDNDSLEMLYATGCGFGNNPPEMRDIMERAIHSNSRRLMNIWLHSPNTETQVYAVEAYYRMRRRWKTTSEERRIIYFIMHKKGTIASCSGCLVGFERTISKVCRQFKFNW